MAIVVRVADTDADLWARAYDPLALEAFVDFATFMPIVVSREQWERDWLDWPEATTITRAAPRTRSRQYVDAGAGAGWPRR